MESTQVAANRVSADAPVISSDPASLQLQALTSEELVAVQYLVRLEGNRAEILQQLKVATAADRAELNKSLASMDEGIATANARLASIRSRVAELSRSPNPAIASTLSPPPTPQGIFGLSPDQFQSAVAFCILFPLVITGCIMALRRSTRAPAPAIGDSDRFARLEQAVEAVAFEVERIGESHRFQSKLMAEREKDLVPVESPK